MRTNPILLLSGLFARVSLAAPIPISKPSGPAIWLRACQAVEGKVKVNGRSLALYRQRLKKDDVLRIPVNARPGQGREIQSEPHHFRPFGGSLLTRSGDGRPMLIH